MSKKVVLITGTSHGMGFDSAKTLAKAGHTVYASMRGSEGKNRDQAAALRNFAEMESVKLRVVELDVTNEASIQAAVERIIEDEGRIDVAVNNAGYALMGVTEAFTLDDLDAQLDVNLNGVVRVTQAVLPHMRKQKSGLNIAVSTIGATPAFIGAGMTPYITSKWALEGFCHCLRLEVANLGIDTVIVQPGPFGTNIFEASPQPSKPEAMEHYPHIGQFMNGFMEMFQGLLADPNSPTDPQVVADTLKRVIDTPAGERPFRVVAGLDFGIAKANNTSTEEWRQKGLEGLGAAGLEKLITG